MCPGCPKGGNIHVRCRERAAVVGHAALDTPSSRPHTQPGHPRHGPARRVNTPPSRAAGGPYPLIYTPCARRRRGVANQTQSAYPERQYVTSSSEVDQMGEPKQQRLGRRSPSLRWSHWRQARDSLGKPYPSRDASIRRKLTCLDHVWREVSAGPGQPAPEGHGRPLLPSARLSRRRPGFRLRPLLRSGRGVPGGVPAHRPRRRPALAERRLLEDGEP
jgi:hypothetical protein